MKTQFALLALALTAIVVTSGCTTSNIIGGGIFGDGRPSLSNLYHTEIDRVAPNYLMIREVDCVAAQGDWFDQTDKIGCYNIPTGNYDSSACSTNAEVILMRNICDAVDNTEWVCTANNIGCYY